MKIEKSRLMELSGFNAGKEPLLLTESGPVYAHDLAEMIQQEVRKVMQEMQIRKAEQDVLYAQRTRSAAAAMGFAGTGFGGYQAPQKSFYGAGGTRGMLGPGFK